MSFDIRILEGRSSVARSLTLATRGARAVRACVRLARLVLAGPGRRGAVRQTLLDVGRLLVEAFDDGVPSTPSPMHGASRGSTSGSPNVTGPSTVTKPGADSAWAVWM